jgi:mono/diheme cytochrome c family protein
MSRLLRALAFACGLALLAWAGFSYWRTRNVSRVERGFNLADRHGCFTCHGPGGLRGMANPGHGLDDVPALAGGLITMYAQSEAEIREWIRDGLPERVRRDPAQMKLREKATILMPAWGSILAPAQIDDLVAYVKAVSDFEAPDTEAARAGRDVACHGPQGRGSAPNPGSLKGYIPSWDGADFPELARDDAEIREWILDARPRRLQANRVARFFLDRQRLQMPGYRGSVSDAELDLLLDYIHWLQAHPY